MLLRDTGAAGAFSCSQQGLAMQACGLQTAAAVAVLLWQGTRAVRAVPVANAACTAYRHAAAGGHVGSRSPSPASIRSRCGPTNRLPPCSPLACVCSDRLDCAAFAVRMMSTGASEPSQWAVVRTTSGQLPVYRCVVSPTAYGVLLLLAQGCTAQRVANERALGRDIRNHNSRELTVIRKVLGDLNALRESIVRDFNVEAKHVVVKVRTCMFGLACRRTPAMNDAQCVKCR